MGLPTNNRTPPKSRTVWERFRDEYTDAASRSLVGYGVRRVADWTDWKKRDGETEAQHDARIRQAERNRRARHARRSDADPVFQSNRSVISDLGHGTAALLGGVTGGADPTYAIAPGGSAVTRIAGQSAVNAGTNAATQGLEINEGVRDRFDAQEVGEEATIGAVFQGGVEGVGRLARALRNRKGTTEEAIGDVADEAAPMEGYQVNPEPEMHHELDDSAFRRYERRDPDGNVVEYGAVYDDGPVTRFDADNNPLPVSREFGDAMRSHSSGDRRAEPRGEEVPSEELGREETFAQYNRPGVETEATVYGEDEVEELLRRRAFGSIGQGQGIIPDALQHFPQPEKTVRSREETTAAGEELGLTPENFPAEGRIGDVSAIAARGAQIVEDSGNSVLRAYDEFGPGSNEYIEALVGFERSADAHSKNSSELGRGLNVLNRNTSPASIQQIIDIANDPVKGDKLAKLIEKYRDDPDALAKIGRDLRDPTMRDRIFSVRYNMMLSGPKTHFYNVVGTAGNLLVDIATHGMGYVLDTPRRMAGQTDVITGREVAARIHGLIAGARGALPNVRQAFREGRPLDGVSRDDMNRRVEGWEVASKAMSAEDEFFRTAANNSAVYGLATRRAFQEGRTGEELDQRINELVELASLPQKVRDRLKLEDKTADTIANEAAGYAKRMRFQDDPSFIGQMIEGMRVRKKGDTPLTALGKDALTLILPFVRTPDSLARTAIRYSPIGVLEGQNIDDWKAGGARRRLAEARVIMGTGVVATIATSVLDGEITGEGPRNYKERQTLEESGDWQPNSIKVGDTWYSYEGMEPLSLLLSGVATSMERWDEGSTEGYLDQAGQQVFNAAEVLTNQTWAEGISDLFDAMTAPEAQRGAAMDNFFANIASSFVVPAALRQVNQAYVDPVVRDTRGDDSLSDRVVNRTIAGIPGLSDDLPAQHDALGREITRGDAFGPDIISRAVTPGHAPEAVSTEMRRLMDVTGKPLLERVDKSLNTNDFPLGRLTATEQQNYQAVTGLYFSAVMEEALQSPEYQAMTDEEKAEYVRDVATQSRKWAREDVFLAEESEEEPAEEPGGDGTEGEYEEFTAGLPTSGRRTEEGNRLVGGVENSAHLYGDGLDFVPAPGETWETLIKKAKAFFGPEAEVIFEGNHVHVELPGMDAPYYGTEGTR
jgi:hypothetical protein